MKVEGYFSVDGEPGKLVATFKPINATSRELARTVEAGPELHAQVSTFAQVMNAPDSPQKRERLSDLARDAARLLSKIRGGI